MSSPLVAGRLSRVSCTSVTACTAVGFAASGTLIESWDGTTWSVASSPGKGSGSGLAGVSCLPAATCTAVGAYTSSVFPHPDKTLIEAGSPSGAQR